MCAAPPIILAEEERKTLTQLAKPHAASLGLARRAQILLRAAGSKSNATIATALGVGRARLPAWPVDAAGEGVGRMSWDTWPARTPSH